jgi:hypothetical protein
LGGDVNIKFVLVFYEHSKPILEHSLKYTVGRIVLSGGPLKIKSIENLSNSNLEGVNDMYYVYPGRLAINHEGGSYRVSTNA